ncbi:trypsin-like peptidase domain-containing protein [Wenzhouxiangella sp. AB-CW3]|uniref:S1C family serine protease n=1 Tax=Wenzhouxiangella sp. AB-CW3 TaxID=2771012 RepID=UPI00168A682E|nr:trypsin-like peptidase domain-containing protein [Wenzhouxiangella sp. AB-CW3]QOC23669.1 trypsin-like peptidase domain-containing protein [Wenzhouxiangella sp. AB-CW3]
MTRVLQFALQFTILGLAVAFVLVWFRPELLPALDATGNRAPDSYAEAVNRTAPAVVSVYTRTLVSEPLGMEFSDPLFSALYRDRMVTRPRQGLGSGVIISSDGLILTTMHVISNVDDILVALWDGRIAEARVVGADPGTDLALLEVSMNDLPVATLSENSGLRTGDVVLAIGNAYGLSHTVTQGIISATGRAHLDLGGHEDFIQTDAAINAGNSGGALINASGEVVGINSASLGQETGAQGISFAIPAPVARRVASQIIEYGQVKRGWLGADLADVTLNLTGQDATRPGARITQIHQGGPAWRAGLQPGDILVQANEQSVASARALTQRLANLEPGREVEFEIIRGNQLFTTSVTLIQQPPLRS